jgi:diguanylate cyclase (GGDEF)-like protein/PAS domain S-box-containing protein
VEEHVYRQILERVDEGVYFVDPARRITYWNPAAERITGYAADEVEGRSCADDVLRHVSESGKPLCLTACPLSAVMRDGRLRQANVYLHHKSGHRVPVVVKGQPIVDAEGRVVGSVELFHERASAHVVVDDPLEAGLDAVTGLVGRRAGQRRLVAASSSVGPHGALGVLFLDVDRFKAVNDEHGHAVGDRVLRMVGQTLAHGLRPTDLPVRWGGEEFLVLMPGADAGMLATAAERLRMLVESTWLDEPTGRLRVTVSVGATLLRPGEDSSDVVDRADQLMYDAKHAGSNIVVTDSGAEPRLAPGSAGPACGGRLEAGP